MNMSRIAFAAVLGAFICIPANAALPTVTKPSVKVTKPAISTNEDGSVCVKKGGIKVEKPELQLPEVKKPEIKKPEIKKPTVEKPSITTDADGIKIKKGGIKLK